LEKLLRKLMKIFTDLHHGSLFESLRILFEDRLGHELYRPIGKEWQDAGFWEIARPYNNAADTTDQYLGFHTGVWNAEKALNGSREELGDGIYSVFDTFHGVKQKAITFEEFKKHNFDLILATYPTHGTVYKNLRDLYQPQAKLAVQIGNGDRDPSEDLAVTDNILYSVTDPKPKSASNYVIYHQEFNLKPFLAARRVTLKKKIVNLMPLLVGESLEYWNMLRDAFPEFEYESWGPGNELGSLHSLREIADKMAEAMFVFHVKFFDGYGHLIHNAYAAGRPVLTVGRAYQGRMGGKLFSPRITGIDLDESEWKEELEFWSQPINNETLRRSAAARFDTVVDFAKEAEEVRSWIQNLR
jgi:hypothetical protein